MPSDTTPRSAQAIASLLAVHVTPLAGILLLGWSPAAVLITYFVDTFLAFGSVLLLVMIHVTGDENDRPISGWKNWTKAAIGLAVLGAIMGFPIAFPLFAVFGDDRASLGWFSNREFASALAVQCAMSGLAAVHMHRELQRRSDDDRVLARRMFFLAARWFAVFVATVTGFVSLLGPRFGSLALVAVYAGASVYFEIFPERAERLLRGKDAKPVTFDGDLESRIARENRAAQPKRTEPT